MNIKNIGENDKMIKTGLKKIYYKIPLSDNTRIKIHQFFCGKEENTTENSRVDIYTESVEKLQLQNAKKVSVVIPNYNYEKYIVERIDSVLFQSYPIFELIILDDNSSDNSVKVIEEKIKSIREKVPVKLIVNEKNSGNVFAQWKKAFEVATGDYIWIAEADDSCSPKFLETVMKGFDDSKVVISYCESLTMDEDGKLLMGNLRPWIDIFNSGKWNQDYVKDGIEEIKDTLCINNTIANVSSVVFRKGEYGDYIEEAKHYKLAGDWYVYMRVLERGKIAYNAQSLNYHRMQKQGMTLSTKHEVEFEEIISIQNYALEHYGISEEKKEKVLERRERERVRFGL